MPAFLLARDAVVHVDGVGELTYDMAYGGNFYALLPAASAGLEVDPARGDELIARGLEIMAAINRAAMPVHPQDERIAGCRHVVFHAPGARRRGARNATAIEPGWLDRSPCGTGTSARMAALHARGELGLGEPFVNESVIGTRFTGRLVEETSVGGAARRGAGDHRPGVGDRDGPVPARRRGPVPGGVRAVRIAVVGAGPGGDRRRRGGARGGRRRSSWSTQQPRARRADLAAARRASAGGAARGWR